MIQGMTGTGTKVRSGRKMYVRGAFLALAALSLLMGTGCDRDEALTVFRDAAGTNLESGVQSIMDGVIEGLFAAFDIGTDSTSTTTTN